MTKYKLIPESFDGNIACYYNDAGYLLEFVINSWNIKPDGHKEILENLGYLLTEQLLPQFAQMMSMQCRKAKIDLSFDRFWIMYGYARNRIQAEKVYNKLTDMKKYYALVNLKGYLLYCKRNPGYTKMQIGRASCRERV